VRFARALRLPETGTHPLPPGLGEFPVRRGRFAGPAVRPARAPDGTCAGGRYRGRYVMASDGTGRSQ
jgi:hypothetical protein